MSDITIDGLTITLGLGDEARKILDDVSFSVRSGQSFGLVGESGSGKSTILKCIGLLFNAWTGRIEIGGKSVRGPRARPTAATCRWCSRTPTARCTRGTRSAPRSPSR